MDQGILVTNRIDDGRRILEQLARDGFDVVIAYWAKAEGDGRPYLYIASPVVEHGDTLAGYQKILSSLEKLPECSLWGGGCQAHRTLPPDCTSPLEHPTAV
jgi:hypothetical protein